MSEYQYYEFRTLHRQLTPAQRAAVDKLSSHGNTTSTSFSVDYSYGDFKHNEREVLARYFDVFFYIANWGSTQLMFRFPRELIDIRSLEPYCIEGRLTVDHQTVADSLILSFEFNDEGGYDWIEGEDQLDGVIGLYDAILGGDYRALYLAWLGTIQDGTDDSEELEDDTLEAPVPPRLNALSPELDAFIEMFAIDKDLVAVAAQGSATSTAETEVDLVANLASLTDDEKSDFLRRLLENEENLAAKLRQRLKGTETKALRYEPTGKRTVGELLAGQAALEKQRKQAAAAAREAKRRAEMAVLVAKGDSVWQEVEDLIEQKRSEGYEKAADLLQQLGDLAREQGQQRVFAARLESIRKRHSRRTAFTRELQRIKL